MTAITTATLPPANVQTVAEWPQSPQQWNQPAVLRPTQAAAYLAISRSYLYLLIERQELALLKLGGRASGIMRTDLDAWLNKQRTAAATAA